MRVIDWSIPSWKMGPSPLPAHPGSMNMVPWHELVSWSLWDRSLCTAATATALALGFSLVSLQVSGTCE